MNNPKTDIKEVNEFFYIDFKKYVYKNRKQINQKLKGLSYRKKVEFLELLWKKIVGKGFGKDADGRDIHYKLKSDKVIKEGLKELGITDFKSLFKKMPSQLQKRVYNLKNFGQRLDKHSEGNVLKHTIMVVNRSIKDDDIDIAIAAMFHDIGKDVTAGIHPKKGHITHFGHEKISAMLSKEYKKWIESVGGNAVNVYYIVKNHMKFKQLDNMGIKKVMKLKAFRAFDKLSKFSKHDRGGLDEDVEESKGRLRPADKLRRKRAMAGKKAAIQRKKKRTQKRKKPLAKLKKIAYKMAYLQVYKQFMEDLFPGMKKNELSIAQAKVVHKNVLRKKGRVMKRAKFRFLPALRDKEAQKFSKKESMDMLDQAFLKAKPIDKEIDETAKRDYKDEYKKFQSSKKSKKYRAELNKYNRDKGTYGNGDGKDASHKGGKIVGFESEKKNRGRAEKSRLKKNG